MELEQLKVELQRLLNEVSVDNFHQYYERFADVIKRYRASGGKGKLVEEYISQLSNDMTEDDGYKDEILADASCRIVGHCSPHLRILFDDFEEVKRKWE